MQGISTTGSHKMLDRTAYGIPIENLKAAGVPMDVIHTLAGHSNVQTTHYNQPTEARKLEAAAAVGKWMEERTGTA